MEWTAPVEHMHGNWPGAIPEVHRWAYDYSKPGQEEDWVSQVVPLKRRRRRITALILFINKRKRP